MLRRMKAEEGEHGVAVWSSPAWREGAVAWLDAQLAGAGIRRTGAVTQPHLRPWATVLLAPTDRGPVWMKAAAPATAFEVGLYELLERVVPEQVLAPIATNADRAWMVLPDGGRSIGDALGGDALLEAMASALARYARMQRDLGAHVEELVALGVQDMRPAAMPDRFEEALALTARAADPERHRAVAALRPQVAAWCERLAAAPGGASLDHNDLHPQNVLIPTPGHGGRFYDFGDSVVAHPFASALVALGFMQHHVLGCAIDDPRLLALRDAYLDPFADLASHAELRATLELACRVAMIARSLIWHRAVSAAGTVEERWAGAPFATLSGLLEESYLAVG